MATTAVATVNTQLNDLAGKYLSFRLASEEFCIQVLKVREIINLIEITTVPQVPEYVKGVINLRGRIIPILDLRLKLGVPAADYDSRTCIIVVQVEMDGQALTVGVVVDGVAEVLLLQASDIQETPALGRDASASGLLGLAKVKGKVKMLLDIDSVVSRADAASWQQYLNH